MSRHDRHPFLHHQHLLLLMYFAPLTVDVDGVAAAAAAVVVVAQAVKTDVIAWM